MIPCSSGETCLRVVQELLLHWLGVKESVAPELPLPRAELLGHFHASMQVGASPLIEAQICLDDHMKPWNTTTFAHKTRVHGQDYLRVPVGPTYVPPSHMAEPDTPSSAAHL